MKGQHAFHKFELQNKKSPEILLGAFYLLPEQTVIGPPGVLNFSVRRPDERF